LRATSNHGEKTPML